jgi:alkylation response protein AidB-like acyl-CoA dehydrogenase
MLVGLRIRRRWADPESVWVSLKEAAMNFDFSDDQKELKSQARRFLTDKCDAAVPRRILETDEPYAKNLWQGISELGFQATAIPEEYGGVGFGYLELCVIAEEMGRAVAPVPFSSSVYLAAEALILSGTDAQKAAYLPKIASGEIIGTLAMAEAFEGGVSSTSFANGAVSGSKIAVPDGDVADFAVVVCGDTLALVDLTDNGVERTTVETVDPTRSHGNITFTNAPGEVLGETGQGGALLARILDRAAVLIAFEQVGGADTCLAMAKDYAVERYAFGRPIGSFQGLKHRMADMYVKNELARSNAYYGAWALSTDAPELSVAAAGARVSATEAYHFASKENIQIHGGIGFTWEYDAQFYYRRSKLLALTLGGPLEWKERLISQLEARATA